MYRRPLLWCAASFAAGIAAPPVLAPDASSTIAFALLFGSLALYRASARHCGERLAEVIAIAFLLGGFFSAGSLASHIAEIPGPESIDRLAPRHEERFREGADVTGTLARALRSRIEPPRHEMLLDVDEVRVGPIRHPATGRILVTAPASPAPAGLARGDRVAFFGSLRLLSAARSPGAFDSRRHMLARGINLTGRLKSWALLRGIATERSPMTRVLRRLDSLRESLLISIASAFPDDARGRRGAGVCMAMLVGERVLSAEDEDALAMAGLNHLLAVSGFNVAILAATMLVALRCVGVGMRWAWLGTLPVLIVYLLMNSEESSVTRAVAMAGTFLLGRACWKHADLLNVLGCAAMVLLAASPLQIGDPGFQLTFAATLALLLAGGFSLHRGKTGAVRRWLLASVAGTTAATLGTLPLVAIHFHRVAPAALPANLIAGPLMAAAFVASLFLPVAAFVSEWLSALLAHHVVLPLIDAVFFIAKWIVLLPGMSWRVPQPSGLWVAAYFLSIAAACLLRRSERVSRYWLAAAIAWLVSLLVIALPRDTRPRPAGLGITMIDVGQGDSLLIETPAGERILVDAGGSTGSSFDVGERVVSPALWRLGIVRLDAAVVTHPDRDHAGGMAAILRNFTPRELWLAGIDDGGDVIRALAAQAARLGICVRAVHAGDVFCRQGARIAILSAGDRAGADRNDGSIVMRVSHRGRQILMMGDAGEDTETHLSGADVSADVLKVGHHGSRTATTESFLSSVAPSIGMISCGRGNRFGHPHPEVTTRLERRGVTVCRTDLEGTLGAVLAPDATFLSGPCRHSERGVRDRMVGR